MSSGIRRRIHHEDVGGKRFERIDSTGSDASNEPLLARDLTDDSSSSVSCTLLHAWPSWRHPLPASSGLLGLFLLLPSPQPHLNLTPQLLLLLPQLDYDEYDWNDKRRKEEHVWTQIFSRLLVQWAQLFSELWSPNHPRPAVPLKLLMPPASLLFSLLLHCLCACLLAQDQAASVRACSAYRGRFRCMGWQHVFPCAPPPIVSRNQTCPSTHTNTGELLTWLYDCSLTYLLLAHYVILLVCLSVCL